MPNNKSFDENNLSFGMEGEDIAALHQVIITLGIEIDEEELKGQRFGETTKEAIRRLQLLMEMEATGEVDEQIYNILKDAFDRILANVNEKDSIVQNNPIEFCVNGSVTDLDGVPLVGVTIVAIACKLRENYEIGQCKTDNQGRYQICYSVGGSEQQISAKKHKAYVLNLQFKVMSKTGNHLYTSGIYFDVSNGANIHIAFGRTANVVPSEFSSIGITLEQYLDNLNPDELLEDEHFNDITFLAGRTGFTKTQIAFYSVAARLANSTELPAEFFYGLFSQDIPSNASGIVMASTSSGVDLNFNAEKLLSSVLSIPDSVLTKAIEIATSKNVIPASYISRTQEDIAKFSPMRVNTMLSATYGMGKTPIKEVLDLAGISPKKQQNFIVLFSKTGSNQDFWKDLGSNPYFTKEEVATLQFSVNIGLLCKGHKPLVGKLIEKWQQGRISACSDLARLSSKRWKGILNSNYKGQLIGVPANYGTGKDQDPLDAFANELIRNFERAYPTQAFLTHVAADNDSPFSSKDKNFLVFFLDTNPDFDLFLTNVDSYLNENPVIMDEDNVDSLRNVLYISKRLIKITSNYETLKPLLRDGIHSSQQIYAMGSSQFISKYKNEPMIGASLAANFYAKAEKTYALALSHVMNLNQINLCCNPVSVGNIDRRKLKQDLTGYPNLETLFGSLDFCTCDQSRTVLSPAAYLVDMLHFLSNRNTIKGGKVSDALLTRRPDIKQIKLNNSNTNTVLPYIDLVNELLEEAVAPPEDCPNYPNNIDAPTAVYRQTSLTTEELNANPQYVNKYAYEKLKDPKIVFPWTLPFNLPLNEARKYLSQIGVDRLQLIRTFSKIPEIPSQQLIDIAIEGLGLTKEEADIITLNSPIDPVECWGLNPFTWREIRKVKTILTRSGINYQTLIQLLDTIYINHKNYLHLYSDGSCNLDDMTIYYDPNPFSLPYDSHPDIFPPGLDQLHRFVRLMRLLKWDVYTLDSAITVLKRGHSNDSLNTLFLRQLYAVKSAMKRFLIPVNVATALFSHIETRDIYDFPKLGDQRYSLYHNLFQNNTIVSPVDTVFDLDYEGEEIKDIGSNPLLIDHKPTLLGAFEISDTDLTLLINKYRKDNTIEKTKLTLDNLSALYRHVVLAKGLGVSINDLISLKALFETEQAKPLFDPIKEPYDPFDLERPEMLEIFCDAADKINLTNFSITELDYLLRHHFVSTSNLAPDNLTVDNLLKSIMESLNKITTENTFSPDPTGTETRKRLASLLNATDVDSIMEILSPQMKYSIKETMSEESGIDSQMIDSIKEIMSKESGTDPQDLMNSIKEILKEESNSDPRQLIKSCLGLFMDGAAAETNLVGENAIKAGQARFEYVLKGLLEYFRRSRGSDLIIQQLANALELPIKITASFVTEWFPSQTDTTKKMIEDFLTLFTQLDVMQDPIKRILYLDYMALDKASKVIKGFGFSSDEIDWLQNNGVKLGWLDLTKLPLTEQETPEGRFIQWNRLADAAIIKKTLPSDGTPFTSLMDIAIDSKKTNIDYFNVLELRTQWSKESMKSFCGIPADTTKPLNPNDPAYNSPQGLLSLKYPEDYCSERALSRLIPAYAMQQRLGSSADVSGWIGSNVTSEQANSIKQCVKAKYSMDQWLQIAKQLRDPLREMQRDALVAYLLSRPAPNGSSWNNSNDIYSYFLIDAEMSSCQMTSRIVQANSSIQLFVLRCFLNLETDITIDTNPINPNADLDWLQWKWMSHYRLWEAGRKVFLYPENWIEPSLRKDKSSFMIDLENDLLQNEVTKDTAEEALLSYLEKLDDVSHLQVVGVYDDDSNVPYVPPINVEDVVIIKVNPEAVTLLPKQHQIFTAEVFGTKEHRVRWSTDGGAIDENTGYFTAPDTISEYAYIVTATSLDGKHKGISKVDIVKIGLEINPWKAYLYPGGHRQFNAYINGKLTAASWSLTDPAYGAAINDQGLFTAPSSKEWIQNITVNAVVSDYKIKAIATVHRIRDEPRDSDSPKDPYPDAPYEP